MDNKYKTSQLIEYLDNLELIDSFGIPMNFGTPDKLKLAEIKNRLLELEKTKGMAIKFCPLLKTDCMKGELYDLPCGEYPSPQCSNEKSSCNFNGNPDDKSEKRCGTCAHNHKVQGGIRGIKVMSCELFGKMVMPVQICYKPEKWWKERK